jgi:proteasome lid subunit RPN8/RPN11
MSTPELTLTAEHDQLIREHGQRTFPYECCGFLLGKKLWEVQAVVPAVNDKGEEEQHNRFVITAEASKNAEKKAKALGLDVIGHYHSHPDSAAIPSTPETVSASADGSTGGSDLDDATWPGYAFAIVSVMAGQAAELTCWNLAEDRSKFNPIPIKIEQNLETP